MTADNVATCKGIRFSVGQNPPEIAYWERGEWWLCGEDRPWQPEAVTVISDRLVFRPRLVPVA